MDLKGLTLAIVASLLVLTGCGAKKIENAKDWPVPEFTYTNQSGESFGLQDLKGKIWVADFIFTKCIDVCPPMTVNMAKLQKMAEEEGLENVEFVSFSVDPTVDSPEVLTEYAKLFEADHSNWNFLTGYSQEEIESFALEYFKTPVKKPREGDQVIHGTSFYLVNQEGTIVQYYSGLEEIPFKQIIKDIKALQ